MSQTWTFSIIWLLHCLQSAAMSDCFSSHPKHKHVGCEDVDSYMYECIRHIVTDLALNKIVKQGGVTEKEMEGYREA